MILKILMDYLFRNFHKGLVVGNPVSIKQKQQTDKINAENFLCATLLYSFFFFCKSLKGQYNCFTYFKNIVMIDN